ncbi:MAG: hypothetical protein HAW63_02870 [Bdellovibrionaceae bacterium]|nr:hypothetical protein [Pseudobdellovibrionaceae bacterium]
MKFKSLVIVKNSGQAVVESILLISLLLGVLSVVVKVFKDKAIVQSLISTPWKQVSSVVTHGYIKKTSEESLIHPNSISRHASNKPSK